MRIFLRQQERLTCLSRRWVKMSKERTGPQSIQPFTAEDKPFSGRRPGVETIYILTVYRRKFMNLSVGQFQQIKITLRMPD